MYTFKKEERLCNKVLIEQLFHSGSSFLCYPFRVTWLPSAASQHFPAQVLFAVPKKRFKKAVDRNAIKRRAREAYRLHKQQHLYNQLTGTGKKIIISIGYIGKELAGYEQVEKKMVKLLVQLCGEVAK
ncbi:ribonuclease P protein component [Mucilaginibacter hurinus]|uniref:Ribonuclease P protein component n=1 Tax=Mucilaginibacter hurinus TaxID=2201324 RepID=A0A367GNW3_9SPHI|nr:ribonuclease P protein component [Mucilaginibacter hurinus]RCH55174.1 ribonuclease P protein component [Mucilaginibacter hurinus]